MEKTCYLEICRIIWRFFFSTFTLKVSRDMWSWNIANNDALSIFYYWMELADGRFAWDSLLMGSRGSLLEKLLLDIQTFSLTLFYKLLDSIPQFISALYNTFRSMLFGFIAPFCVYSTFIEYFNAFWDRKWYELCKKRVKIGFEKICSLNGIQCSI